jgi:hypothetical protein
MFPRGKTARTEGPTPWRAATWAPALLPEPKPKPAMWCCSGEATVRCLMMINMMIHDRWCGWSSSMWWIYVFFDDFYPFWNVKNTIRFLTMIHDD